MKHINILEKVKENVFFREVLFTGNNTQVVVMSINPGEEIGLEVHENEDQILLFTEGKGEAVVGNERIEIKEGDLVLVPAGENHNFINRGENKLKIITTYSPPHHPEGTIHKTKEEADKAEY